MMAGRTFGTKLAAGFGLTLLLTLLMTAMGKAPVRNLILIALGGVAFLGIAVRDNNRDAAVDFVVDRKVTFPSIYDPAMRTMIAFGGRYPTTVIPSTVVLDRQHRVAAVFLRELLAQDLQPLVERLAAEKPTAT